MSEEKDVKKSKKEEKKVDSKKETTKKETIEVEGEVVEETKAESTSEKVKEKVKEAGKKIDIDTDEIKSETVETYNQVKDTLKNVDIKKDAEEAKGFILEVFTNPFAAIKDAVSEKKNVFGKAIIIVILWIAIGFIAQFISNIHYHFQFAELIRTLLNPLWYVLVISGVLYLFNHDNKKPLTAVISTVVTASMPRLFMSVVAVLDSIIDRVDIVTTPVTLALRIAGVVLTYFAAKELLGVKADKDFFRKFVIIVFVIEFVFKLLSLIGIGSISL